MSKLKETVKLSSENTFSIDYPKYQKLWIDVDEIIIQSGKIQLKLPTFWDLDIIDTITFTLKGKTYTYKKSLSL